MALPLPENTLRNADGTPYSAGHDAMSAEAVARLFHEAYETRNNSAVPWEQVPEKNKKLMIAAAGVVLNHLAVQFGIMTINEAREQLGLSI